jgi:ACR3 family arsenite transporter
MADDKMHLGVWEKYLAIWVALCMAIGLLLSQVFPGLSIAINSWQYMGISIPIGICLFLMIYPALLNIQLSEIRKITKAPKPIVLTILSNWILAPIVTVVLANMFLAGHDQLIVSLILLGASPCTAMVLVWGKMAEGNQEQNLINTSLNTVTIMVLYVPIVALLTGIQNIPIDWMMLVISVVVFIGIPMVLGYLSKRYLTNTRGEEWFQGVYRPAVGKVSMIALLVSIPLLLGFFIVVGINLLVTKFASLRYEEGIITVIIGSSSHFEIAIATAIALYGLGSQAALGTTMGLFWEVPIMLSLVYLGKRLNKRGFWKQETVTAIDSIS